MTVEIEGEAPREVARWRLDAQDRLERALWSIADERLEHLCDADLGEDASLAAALFKTQCEGVEFVWRTTLGDGDDALARFRDARLGEGLRLSNGWDGASDPASRRWIAPIMVALDERGEAPCSDRRWPAGNRRLVLIERVEGNRITLVSDAYAHGDAVRALELVRQSEPAKMVRLERARRARRMIREAPAARSGSGRRGPLRVVYRGLGGLDLRTEAGRFRFTLLLASEVRRKGQEVARKVSREELPPRTASVCFGMHLDGMLSAIEAVVSSEGRDSYLAAVASRLEEEMAIAREAIREAAPDGTHRDGAPKRTAVASIEIARERRRRQKSSD